MKIKNIIFWVAIIAIIFFTRFYKLVSYPPGLTIDEVSIGYNAYSILKTGKDEWGNFMPISFRSVGDYKSPVLIYLTVPFVKFFGLNEFGTRLPVAIFSSLNVLLIWVLTKRYIFKKNNSHLAYLATLIYSLSPWLITYSRSGFEAVLAQSFLLINVIFAYEFRKSGRLINFFLMFFFAYLSAITYHSTKIVVPLLNLTFILLDIKLFKKYIISSFSKNRLSFFLTAMAFITLTSFFIGNFILGSGSSRAQMTFLTKDFDYAKALLPVYLAHPLSQITSLIGLIGFWYKRFLEYFSANFYLTTGLGLTIPGFPGQGVLYAVEFPLLIIGGILLFLESQFSKNSISDKFTGDLLKLWFLIAFLPASLTNNSQHALRSLNALPVIAILICLAIIFVYQLARNKLFKYLIVALLITGYVVGVIRFVDIYTIHYPTELSETRSYGWKQMAIYAWEHHTEYDKVYVDPRFGTSGPYTYGVPYMYFLFYSRYDPNLYVNDPLRKTGRSDFANFYITNIDWPALEHKNNLFIASPWSFPQSMIKSKKQLYFVPFLNQSSGLYAITD